MHKIHAQPLVAARRRQWFTRTLLVGRLWGTGTGFSTDRHREWEKFQLQLPIDLEARTPPYTVRREDLDAPDDAIVAFLRKQVGGARPALPSGQLSDWGVRIHSVDEKRIVACFSGGSAEGTFAIRRRRR